MNTEDRADYAKSVVDLVCVDTEDGAADVKSAANLASRKVMETTMSPPMM